jgi:hypothetical protein
MPGSRVSISLIESVKPPRQAASNVPGRAGDIPGIWALCCKTCPFANLLWLSPLLVVAEFLFPTVEKASGKAPEEVQCTRQLFSV